MIDAYDANKALLCDLSLILNYTFARLVYGNETNENTVFKSLLLLGFV